MEFIPYIIVLMVSVILHEIAHGFAALRLGDPTAREAGRLTANPIAHVDLIGTILFPGFLILSGSSFLFGWAKPVPINPRYFRNPATGMAIVGIAGPATNIAIAIVAAILLRLLIASGAESQLAYRLLSMGGSGESNILIQTLVLAVRVNVILAVFNMLPIPPLDGSRVIIPLVPRSVGMVYYQLEPYGMFIVLGLMITGILSKLIAPPFIFIYRLLLGI